MGQTEASYATKLSPMTFTAARQWGRRRRRTAVPVCRRGLRFGRRVARSGGGEIVASRDAEVRRMPGLRWALAVFPAGGWPMPPPPVLRS
jgi:hypothetical protein